MEIKNKVIIITGASSGIGEAAAKALAAKGAKVALVARSEDKLKELSNSLADSFVVKTDMTNEVSIKNMVEEVAKHYGHVDALINNAGRGTDFGPVEKIDINEFRNLMDLNIYGPIVAMQEVIPELRKVGGGAIVNIGSGTVYMMAEGMSVYPGTKVLLQHITRTARLELAKDNIAVTILHPYVTKTNFFDRMDQKQKDEYLSRGDEPEKVADKIVEALETGAEIISLAPEQNK
jgi:short-subunit dehydrogenase